MTFTATTPVKEILIHDATGALIGALMPVKWEGKAEPVDNPTDAQVFAYFSCAENDYYLAIDKELMEHIGKWETELDAKEEQSYHLESQIETLRRNIESGRERLKALAAKVSA